MASALRFFTVRSVRYATLNYPYTPADLLRLDPNEAPPLPFIDPSSGQLGRINIANLCATYSPLAPYLPWVAAPADSIYSSLSRCEFNGIFAPVFPMKWLTATREGLVPSEDAWKIIGRAIAAATFAVDQVVEVAKSESVTLPASSLPPLFSVRPAPFNSNDYASAWLRLTAAKVKLYIAFVHWFLDTHPDSSLPSSILPSTAFYDVPTSEKIRPINCTFETDASSYRHKLGCIIDFGGTSQTQWAAVDLIKIFETHKVPYIFPVPENLLDNAVFDRFRPIPLRDPTPPPKPPPPPPHQLPPMKYYKVSFDRGKEIRSQLTKADGKRMSQDEVYYSRIDRQYNVCYISDLPFSGDEEDVDDDFGPYRLPAAQSGLQRAGPRPETPPLSDAARTPSPPPSDLPVSPRTTPPPMDVDYIPTPLRVTSPRREDTDNSSANELRAVPPSHRPNYVPSSRSRAPPPSYSPSTRPPAAPRSETIASSSYYRPGASVRRRTEAPRRSYLTRASGNTSSSSSSAREPPTYSTAYRRSRRGRSPSPPPRRQRDRQEANCQRRRDEDVRTEQPASHNSGWGSAVASHGWNVPRDSESASTPASLPPTTPQGDGGWAGMFARSQTQPLWNPGPPPPSSASVAPERSPPPRVVMPPLLPSRPLRSSINTAVPSLASRLAIPRAPTLAERLAMSEDGEPSLLHRMENVNRSPPLSPSHSAVRTFVPPTVPLNTNAMAVDPVPAADASPQVYRRRAFLSLFWDVLPSPVVPTALTEPQRLLSISMVMRRRFLEVAPSFTSLNDAVAWLVESRVPFRLYVHRDHIVVPQMTAAPSLPDYFRFDPEPFPVLSPSFAGPFPASLYGQYLLALRAIATYPHARAFLSRGSLVSRLVDWGGNSEVEARTFDRLRALTPSEDLVVHQRRVAHSSLPYLDDQFSPAELLQLVGAIRVTTPTGQTSLMYFFPPLRVFEDSPFWTGSWTMAAEQWFIRRAAAILERNAPPWPEREWQRALRQGAADRANWANTLDAELAWVEDADGPLN
ncbi:hypothetical protein SISSUDRAFT_1066996 [Sistotremastrum suecicum HHB10207 ss-3]|uniref:Uncharacterized protein n=1 Tax=Sistotremastrum suecicum HHB10207 ss-3 TaxID=1314776 RepID=A0A165XMU3_9AGAM|nr:hypothetical protein SISSUDRAFT_1066996 [Sistotremastrum suecicum HHB10207 ss-3]